MSFTDPSSRGPAALHPDGRDGAPVDPAGPRLRARVVAAAALASLGLVAGCSFRRGPAYDAPVNSRAWDAYRVELGRRLVAANPGATYTGAVPEPLLAIPVLEIELHRDGSVRDIRVQRRPTQAPDTVQLAIDAVRRAAPFGSVAHLPTPWRVSEVFLFRDDRKFKPRSLDL